ncbi:MAG: DUF3786 domain-containing protein [Thermoplasmata archaeon]|nr:MAG: DUF3786 domain-containing protein [Thermoplasmata archaeon]
MPNSNDDAMNKEWEAILSGKGKDNLADVLERGWDELVKRDPGEVAEYGLVEFDKETESYNLPFMNETFLVNKKTREIKPKDPSSKTYVSSFLATLLVHYLASVKNLEVENKPISFREVPGGGDVYYPAFQNNAIRPIMERFGENPEELIPAGERLGGKPIDKGDAAVEIPVFPKIPVTVIVWAGDEEIPANATILFDVTAKEQIHIEDLAVIGGVVAGKLIKF